MLLKNSGLRVVEFKDGGKIEIGFNDDRFNNVFWGESDPSAGDKQLGDWCASALLSPLFNVMRWGSC